MKSTCVNAHVKVQFKKKNKVWAEIQKRKKRKKEIIENAEIWIWIIYIMDKKKWRI